VTMFFSFSSSVLQLSPPFFYLFISHFWGLLTSFPLHPFSLPSFSFAAIMQNEFEDRDFGRNCTIAKEEFCFETGAEVLDFYSIEDLSLGQNLGILVGLSFAFRLFAYYILRRNGPIYSLAV
jgi:hypothetical protein